MAVTFRSGLLAGQSAAVLSFTSPLAGFVSCKKYPKV